jgi:hypothetical protein
MKPMPAKARIIMTQVDGSGTAEENSLRRKDFDYRQLQYSGTPAPIHRNNLRCRPRQADGDCGIYAQIVYTYARYTAVPNPPIATSGYQRVKYIAGPSNQLRRSDSDKPK